MKQQFRSMQTRKKIEQAFFSLLQTKNFHEITINQLVEHAKIGRSTFYFHYEDKHDLLKQIVEKYVQQFDEIMAKRFDLVNLAIKNANDFFDNDYLAISIQETIDELKKQKTHILILLTVQIDTFAIYQQYQAVLKRHMYALLEAHPIRTPTLAQLPTDYVIDIASQTFLTSIIWLLGNGESDTILTFISEFQYTIFKLISPYLTV